MIEARRKPGFFFTAAPFAARRGQIALAASSAPVESNSTSW
jgi:hypothetical protein